MPAPDKKTCCIFVRKSNKQFFLKERAWTKSNITISVQNMGQTLKQFKRSDIIQQNGRPMVYLFYKTVQVNEKESLQLL